jgi:S-adenosyl-methyltransferase MraW
MALADVGWDGLDFILADIGVSSLQIDRAERGFSFLADGPLDMRMDPGQGRSAEVLVNESPVTLLKDIIRDYGEDPMAGRIARAIDDARAQKRIESTLELARIVERAYPAKWRATSRNHPATRTFQALRMTVNNELGELETFLRKAVGLLRPGGRVAVITFHSLEDRMVKHFFRDEATGCRCPRHVPLCVCGHEASLKVLTRKPVGPSGAEASANARAASAKLRVAERIGHE